MESTSGKGKSKNKIEKSKGKEKAKEKISASHGKEPETTEKEEEVEVEYAIDAEIKKLEISDEEEKEPETEAKKTSEYLSAQKSREAMLNRMEKDLIEEHNRKLYEAIKHGKAEVEHTKSLIESMEKLKNVNERRLSTLKVKATPYIPTSEKPKRVKHTVGRNRVNGRKPPLHPSSE
ncbi:hypothetical protein JCGZ_05927 [Jatropha curcas]|uniref:Uncharacterized protein n=1 Tax=Jatropha curcas TaxID=180498 RepID=A0A067KR44_JATCU|nr:hypothetical protein JCGZ_05927 [Jatropha curcas]